MLNRLKMFRYEKTLKVAILKHKINIPIYREFIYISLLLSHPLLIDLNKCVCAFVYLGVQKLHDSYCRVNML